MNFSGENFHSLKIMSRDFTLRQNASQHLRSEYDLQFNVLSMGSGQWSVFMAMAMAMVIPATRCTMLFSLNAFAIATPYDLNFGEMVAVHDTVQQAV